MIITIMNQKRGHRFSKLPNDGDPWAPNYLLKSGANENHQLNPGGPNKRQEAPVPKQLKLIALYWVTMESATRP